MENGGKQTWKSLEERKRERVGIMVYIQLERRALLALCYWSAGTDLVELTFQLLLIRLRNCRFFFFFVLFCFFNFIFSLSVSIEFLDVFFVSLPSFTHPPPPLPLHCSRQEGNATICFAPDHSFDYSCVLGLRKKGNKIEWEHLKSKDRLEELYLFLQPSFLTVPSLSPWNLDTHGTL